jgi:hypothetical protein
VPFLGPERPEESQVRRPGDFVFEAGGVGGEYFHRSVDGDPSEGRDVLIFLGTPELRRSAYVKDGRQVDALTIKADTIVAWVDRTRFPQLAWGAPTAGAAKTPAAHGRRSASVVPDAILAVYAEGAVEMRFGDLRFRAQQLYIDPHTYKALLVEPRFDGHARGLSTGLDAVPMHVRARRMREISKGFLVFDDAEASTSRADDHLALEVRTLTVQELNAAVDAQGVPRAEILGFYADSSQWYSARTLILHGERLPLMWLPRADFGLSDKTEALATPLKNVRAGRKSEVGRFLFVRVGQDVGPGEDPWFQLQEEFGGYLKRGWAGGLGLRWNHTEAGRRVRSVGRVDGWGVVDHRSFDSDGYVAGHEQRGRLTSESRTWIGSDLILDHELNLFSDRGFNNEFFERDDLQHKDRESYVRGRWAPSQPGNLVATLDLKGHPRSFVSETVQLPEAGVWVFPTPILVPTRRGGLGLDLTTEARAGYLGRRFDDLLPTMDYEAWRFLSDTRLNAGLDVGDVRLSGYVGASGAAYEGRTDGGRDLQRGALLAGARADLQAWRVLPGQGGWFELDGLRHVVDVDVGLDGRFWDSHAPADVPWFDLHDGERARSGATLRVRNRLQTRRHGSDPGQGTPGGAPPASDLRTLADLDVGVRTFFDDRGPFGRTSPGDLQVRFYGEPRPGFELAGDLDADFDGGIQTSSVSAGLRSYLASRPLSIFGGLRYVRGRSTSVTADASWRFSQRYAVRLREVVDFRDGEDLTRVLFRRYSDDHIIVFGLSLRNGHDVGLELSFEPAIGGRTTEGPEAFKDEPDLNPWGTFPR